MFRSHHPSGVSLSFPELHTLTLSIHDSPNSCFLQLIKAAPNLTLLDLHECQSEKAAPVFVQMSHCAHLQRLCL